MNKKLTAGDIGFFIALAVICAGLIGTKIYSQREKGAEASKAIVGVHVKGEVKNSGYYELEYGSRVKDAVKKAGGATENADTDAINLAMLLTDGQEIFVPEKSNNSSDGNTKNSKVNINTANIYELCSLPGVGEPTAEKIIRYRKTKGSFASIEELKKVSGIGEEKYNDIKDFIAVR